MSGEIRVNEVHQELDGSGNTQDSLGSQQMLVLLDSFAHLADDGKEGKEFGKIKPVFQIKFRLPKYSKDEIINTIIEICTSRGWNVSQDKLKKLITNEVVLPEFSDPKKKKLLLGDAVEFTSYEDRDAECGCIQISSQKITLEDSKVVTSLWVGKLLLNPPVNNNGDDAKRVPHGHISLFGFPAYTAEYFKSVGKDAAESAAYFAISREISFMMKSSFAKESNFIETYTAFKQNNECIEKMNELHKEIDSLPQIGLALDGGGSRGTLTALIIKDIFQRLKGVFRDDPKYNKLQDIYIDEMFDDLSGTSAGAIIASSIWAGICSIDDLPAKFASLSEKIFAGGPCVSAISLGGIATGLSECLYSSNIVNEAISSEMVFYDTEVDPFLSPILTCLSTHTTDVTYNPYVPLKTCSDDSVLFHNMLYKFRPSNKVEYPHLNLGEAARASMAAPGYLSVLPVRNIKYEKERQSKKEKSEFPMMVVLADGGILNNNPSVSLFTDNVDLCTNQSKGYYVVSIGTGFKWTEQQNSVVLATQLTNMTAPTINDEMLLARAKELFKNVGVNFNYYRLQVELDKYQNLDEPSYESLEYWDKEIKKQIIDQDYYKEMISSLKEAVKQRGEFILKRRAFLQYVRRHLREAVKKLVPVHPALLSGRPTESLSCNDGKLTLENGKLSIRSTFNMFASAVPVTISYVDTATSRPIGTTLRAAYDPNSNMSDDIVLQINGTNLGWAKDFSSFLVRKENNVLTLTSILTMHRRGMTFTLHHPVEAEYRLALFGSTIMLSSQGAPLIFTIV